MSGSFVASTVKRETLQKRMFGSAAEDDHVNEFKGAGPSSAINLRRMLPHHRAHIGHAVLERDNASQANHETKSELVPHGGT